MDIPPPAIKNNIFLGVDTSKVVAGRILSPEETRQSVLNSKEIKKSKKNWHFWFKVRGGHRIMRQHFCGSPYTFQQAHHIFKTGRFKFSSEAAVCLDTNKAREYVIKQI